MTFSDPLPPPLHPGAPLPRPTGPLVRFVLASALFAAVAGVTGAVLAGGMAGAVVGLAGFAVIAGVAGVGLWRSYPHDRLGGCNLVTLFRSALIAGVAAALLAPAQGWALAGVATVAFALDGVDGKLARASGLVSDFGARFDMEVDSVLALVLACIVWLSGAVGPWVLVLGVMRYLWVAAGWVLPWINAPLPEQVMRRKTVCVIQIAALVLLVSPLLTGAAAAGVALVAAGILLWSFGADLVWLWQRRAA
jgi:phosphatidylglycerophosphate synthase